MWYFVAARKRVVFIYTVLTRCFVYNAILSQTEVVGQSNNCSKNFLFFKKLFIFIRPKYLITKPYTLKPYCYDRYYSHLCRPYWLLFV